MPNPALDLIAEIGRELTRAGDALFEARVKFGELRKLWHSVQERQVVGPLRPGADPVPASVPDHEASAATAPPPHAKSWESQVKHRLNGELTTVQRLANIAGCSRGAMEQRLRSGMSPEDAVAAGARKPRSDRKDRPAAVPKARPAAVVAPKVARPPARAIPASRPSELKLAADLPASIPDDVKRTIAPTPPGRFHVEQAPPLFSAMRPGQYEVSESAVSRAYADRKP